MKYDNNIFTNMHFTSSVVSGSIDSLVPTPSPFGPTFSCSISHLPSCSIVVTFWDSGLIRVADMQETLGENPNIFRILRVQGF